MAHTSSLRPMRAFLTRTYTRASRAFPIAAYLTYALGQLELRTQLLDGIGGMLDNGLRSIAAAQGLVISASEGGKIKTALQLVAIMMLLIYFRYPALGTGIPVDYHRAGLVILYVSTAVSVYSGIQYMRHFLLAALKQSRASA